jgi:hypothetical protein
VQHFDPEKDFSEWNQYLIFRLPLPSKKSPLCYCALQLQKNDLRFFWFKISARTVMQLLIAINPAFCIE